MNITAYLDNFQLGPKKYNLSLLGPEGSGWYTVTTPEKLEYPHSNTYTYYYVANLTFEAKPSSHWSFSHWLLDGVDVGSTNPYTVTLTKTTRFKPSLLHHGW
jgi:hypothetical protein